MIKFQAFEWFGDNEEVFIDEISDIIPEINEQGNEFMDEEEEVDKIEVYTIRIYGIDENSRSVRLKVKNFPPYFYIKVPDKFGERELRFMLDYLQFVIKSDYDKKSYPFSIVKKYCRVEKKIDFYGFTNGKKQNFFKLVFNNTNAMKKCISLFRKPRVIKRIDNIERTYQIYEGNVDPLIRFIHSRKLQSTGWISIDDDDYEIMNIRKETKEQRGYIELEAEWFTINHYESDDVAPIVQASFDIECNSVDFSFPKPDVEGNAVIQIATAFKKLGDDDFYLKHIIVLGECNDIVQPNTILEKYKTEKEVLMAWGRLLKLQDPDIIYSYNGDGFDCEYMYRRAIQNRIIYKWCKSLGRYGEAELKEEGFSSSAYGDNKYKRLKIPGRINFDILTFIKREYKLVSYKLDNVAKKYLNQEKHDVTAKDIFKYYQSKDPEKVRIVAEYCIQDTLLPQRLVDKLGILLALIEMAKATYVPVRYLFEKGQQVKVYAQILRLTKEYNYLVPVIKPLENSEKFKGAIVLEPVVGSYFEPVTTLDFASLYPSIMRAHKMCYSTFIINEKYDNLEGIEYYTVEWEEYGKIHRYRYAQIENAILPILLDDLYSKRKATKKLMKNEQDSFKKMVLDKKQLSYKVSMNSVNHMRRKAIGYMTSRHCRIENPVSLLECTKYKVHYDSR